jgi:hypothetical protein
MLKSKSDKLKGESIGGFLVKIIVSLIGIIILVIVLHLMACSILLTQKDWRILEKLFK